MNLKNLQFAPQLVSTSPFFWFCSSTPPIEYWAIPVIGYQDFQLNPAVFVSYFEYTNVAGVVGDSRATMQLILECPNPCAVKFVPEVKIGNAKPFWIFLNLAVLQLIINCRQVKNGQSFTYLRSVRWLNGQTADEVVTIDEARNIFSWWFV